VSTTRKCEWAKLRPKLVYMERNGLPIETLIQRRRNTIIEVGRDYVVVKSDGSNSVHRKIFAEEIEFVDEASFRKRRVGSIVSALRHLSLDC